MADKESRNCVFSVLQKKNATGICSKKNYDDSHIKKEAVTAMKIGNREFDVANRTYIMGILNVTPDSFSDGGKWNTYGPCSDDMPEAMIARRC